MGGTSQFGYTNASRYKGYQIVFVIVHCWSSFYPCTYLEVEITDDAFIGNKFDEQAYHDSRWRLGYPKIELFEDPPRHSSGDQCLLLHFSFLKQK